MSITAKELAGILHMSPAAVSIALNNRPGVSNSTRKMVLEAADKYGYDFSRLNKKSNARGPIYYVIYKKHGAVVDKTDFFSALFEGIEKQTKAEGYKLVVSTIYENEEMVNRQIEDIQYSDCAGVIVLGTEMAIDDIRKFQKLPIPFVLLDTYFEEINCDCVLINNVQGAYQAASHLIKVTGKQPGYLRSSYTIGNFLERNSGFFKAVRAHGMASGGSAVHYLTPSIEGAYSDMKEIIRSKEKLASAYFVDNDLIALGAMKALKEFGYRIPEDIAIVGFDNIPASSIVEPSLSTINVPKTYMGEVVVKRIVERINNPKSLPQKIQINTTLIPRRSSDPDIIQKERNSIL